jgi:hypothetical protein
MPDQSFLVFLASHQTNQAQSEEQQRKRREHKQPPEAIHEPLPGQIIPKQRRAGKHEKQANCHNREHNHNVATVRSGDSFGLRAQKRVHDLKS